MVTAQRIIGALAAGVAALGVASAGYQAVGEARDRRHNPPPGHLVDVGGHRLHILCAGEGSPPVVICPALGATVDEWTDVLRLVSPKIKACVYDRAGLGYSESPRRHRTATTMAEELHALLHGAGIEPPYVLAGHSLGGLVARMFVHLYPDEIAGLALIDSSHPGQRKRLPRSSMRDYPGGKLLEVALTWVQPLGLLRLAHDLGIRKKDPGWVRHRRADGAELLAFDAICRDTGKFARYLGDLPLAVATSCELDPNYPSESRAQRDRSDFYRGWLLLQNELPNLSADSTRTMAEYGGHHLNRDNPEFVAQVLTDLVKRSRLHVHESG